jgi:Fe-S cluster assembly iron-binding protein IscA
MLQITDTAKEKLQGILDGKGSKYLRVYIQGMG